MFRKLFFAIKPWHENGLIIKNTKGIEVHHNIKFKLDGHLVILVNVIGVNNVVNMMIAFNFNELCRTDLTQFYDFLQFYDM